MLTRKKSFIITLFGLISGFTIMISDNTLNYWLAKEQIDLKTIGIFAFITIPYAINFLWAPVFDAVKLGYFSKWLGQRLSWILLIQIFLAIAVLAISRLMPSDNLLLFAVIGLVISFLSSAQDTVLGALRTEVISKESQGAASGTYTFGYRIGMLISGFGAIYLSDYLSWNRIYEIFALLIFICSIAFLLLRDLLTVNQELEQSPLQLMPEYNSWICKFSNFLNDILKPIGSWYFISLVIAFLVLYRLPDNFIAKMINPFLIHIGYDSKQIATTGKFFGIIAAIVGGLIAGRIMKKCSIIDSLLIFGWLHAIAHSLFILQEIYGKNILLFFIATGFESLTNGMSMAAYIGFIASVCQGKFRATQYAFFSSMMGFSRSIFPAISGYIAVDFGWNSFFAFTSIAAIPSLIILLKIRSLGKYTITGI